VALFAWAGTWAAGEAGARVLFGRRHAAVGGALRLPLGLAALICLLEATGYFLPLRLGAFVVLLPVAFGCVLLARRRHSFDRAALHVVLASLAGLVLGLLPIVIAGRLTAAALTNNDATYYVTVTDRLLEIPWRIDERVLPAECLRERVLKGWFWRTGTPNLMGAICALTGLSTTEAIAIATALLTSCVPATALWFARGLGVASGSRAALLVAALSAFSAASLFLGYQHLTGQLAAYALFPSACAATVSALERGGVRRLALSALLLGGALAFLADAGAVLVLAVVAGALAARRRPLRALGRVVALAALCVAFAPFTMWRAYVAGSSTLGVRVGSGQPMFPQRGWLPRSLLDDLGTLTGVDPWPPWPAPWPPTLQSVLAALGALAAAALAVFAAQRLARGGPRLLALLIAVSVAASLLIVTPRYLIGKILLMAAGFAVPLCATGAALASSRRRARWLVVPFAVAQLTALIELGRASRWKVIDRLDHDVLVDRLKTVPRGSLIALDGFGAPADAVLDAHRAHRAALLDGLIPLQPGLDGGFYRPRCQDPVRPAVLPARAYALQRRSAETLTRGPELFGWGDFAVVEADLGRPDGFVAAWAPTHGWLAAEREPDGRVFRWAERESKGTLRTVQAAPCTRLHGELRTSQGTALASILGDQSLLFSGHVGSEWTKFVSRPIEAAQPSELTFRAEQQTLQPLDAAHVLALRGLSLQPDWQCLTLIGIGAPGDRPALPVELKSEVEWEAVPAVGLRCGELVVLVAAEPGATLGLIVNRGPVSWQYSSTATVRISSPPISTEKPLRVQLVRRGPAEAAPWRVLDVAVSPRSSCK
jgi:hypothetical protein